MTDTKTEIIPYLFYRDVGAASDWLAGAFGFEEVLRTRGESGGTHVEMVLGGCRIMMGSGAESWKMLSPATLSAATQGVFVYIADVDAHFGRAKAAGAEIVQPLTDLPYGRSYTARDLDGHPWFFTTPPT